MVIKERCSYSRYRGITDRSRYDAVDDLFRYEVDGNIICTDNERNIDCDGNIIILTPEGDVLHIGEVLQTEEGSGPVKFSMDADQNLHMEYRVFLDNDHHHSDIEEDIIDCHLTPERKRVIERHRLMEFLNNNLKAYYGGKYRNELNFYENETSDTINLRIKVKILGRWNENVDWVKIIVSRNDNGQYEVKESDDFAKFDGEQLFTAPGKGDKPVRAILEQYYKENPMVKDMDQPVQILHEEESEEDLEEKEYAE